MSASEDTKRTYAHTVPLGVFLGIALIYQMLVEKAVLWDHPHAPWWRHYPEQWLYPLQAIVCAILLIRWWRQYEFNWSLKWSFAGVVFGAVGIGLWLLPTTLYDHLGMAGEPEGWKKLLGLAARTEGFNPGVFANPVAYWASLILRFFRAAVIVALVEEIFWRGFLMRFLLDMDGNYWKQPFGKASWLSFGVVTAAFTIAHQPIDYAAAIVYGSLTYLLAIWSKNLGACVIMHATANFLMGCYIMTYGKYGLW